MTKVLQRGQSMAITCWVRAASLCGKIRIMTTIMADMKLQALDAEDLGVVSAQCQDATVRVADLAYVPADKRFVLVCNRFDWLAAQSAGRPRFERRRSR